MRAIEQAALNAPFWRIVLSLVRDIFRSLDGEEDRQEGERQTFVFIRPLDGSSHD